MKFRKAMWMCGLAVTLAIVGAMTGGRASAQRSSSQDAAVLRMSPMSSAVANGSGAGECGDFSAIPDEGGHGLNLADLDTTAKPCQDFFQFADGGWIKNNPIPPAYPRWGTFNVLRNHNQDVLRQILEDDAKANAARGSNVQKVGDLYAVCMNTAEIEKQGIGPLKEDFAQIASIGNLKDVETETARLQKAGVDALFEFDSSQDFKDSTQMIGDASQGGLGMPDRDYYTKTDDASKKLRDQYVAHVGRMFVLLGDAPEKAAAEAQTVMTIETKLAQASMTRVDRRNPDNVYHPMDRTQLSGLMGNFSWNTYLDDVGVPHITKVNVAQPEFFKALDADLAATSMDDWKIYLRWHLIHSTAPYLSENFVNENFDFYTKTLTGATEILPRWRRCVSTVDDLLGEALGQEYVKVAFPPEAKAQALEIVHNLIAALRDDITTLDWMGPETRKQALMKLDVIMLKIGYPDKWRDYSKYNVDRGPFMLSVERGEQFEFTREMDKIGKPVDRTEWGMTPPTVNAYYNPEFNEIVFPAGILQPPFFDPKRDAAMNYGGMGAVIGHELSHGFDDQGAKFDAQGNLRDWWTPEDLKNFQARSQCVIKQFDGYEVEPGLHENGKLVVGESIGDLGGLAIAYRALQKVLVQHPEGTIDGFTPDQRFFISWAHGWAASARPEYQRLQVNTNPHPLDRFRAFGPLSNMPSFQKAFGCKESDPMVRAVADRCQIW
jgi:predicted metalloendopeptidase